MKGRFLYLLFCIGWMACEKGAEIELPNPDPKMALSCFLSPGLPVQVYLQSVEPLFSDIPTQSPSPILNAAIFFSNGSDTVQLNLKFGENFYEELGSKIPVIAGNSYYIWASAPLFPSVSSSCTVPRNYVDSFLVKYEGANNGDDSTFQLSMDWLDISNEDNYYRVRAENVDSLIGGGYEGRVFSFSTSYFNDIGKEGDIIQTGIGSYSTVTGKVRSRWITALLITCDVNYFRYHLSVEEAVNGNPFVQPSSLFSNVTGGVGCFGAYLQHTAKIQVF